MTKKKYAYKGATVFMILCISAVILLAGPFSSVFASSDMFIYPKEGQSEAQLDKDKYECYSWAKKQSNFDPMEIPKATAPPPREEVKKGGAGRGALRGALLGAAIGEIANDDAGKGAAIGAGTGALFGGMRRHRQVQEQQQAEQQWAEEQTSQYVQQRSSYNRAFAACLEARGYTVK